MARTLYALAAGLMLTASSGCAVCQSPFDFCYPAYGGRWQEESSGARAGSAFGGVMYGDETVIVENSGSVVSPPANQPREADPPPMATEMEQPAETPMFVPRDTETRPSAPAAPTAPTPLDSDLNP